MNENYGIINHLKPKSSVMKNLNFLRFATRLALLLTVVVSLGLSANAQVTVPDGFQYQAIARDANGVAMTAASIAVQFTVTDDNGFNNVETHNVMTNDFGLFNLVVAAGVDFEGLVNPMVNVQIDLGSGYVDMGTVPFQSVPYAAVAGNVAYVDNGMLHVGDDAFNVGNFFTGTPGIVEPLQAVVVDANKSIAGFGDVATDGTLSVGSTIEAQDYVRILSTANNTYGNWQSGALQVKGGAGIANDVWIGGDIVIGGSITGLSLAVTNGITAGGDITGGGDLHITDIYAAGDAYITGDLEAANITTGVITATTVNASDVTADDFYGNFHGGTLDLGAAKSVTVGDILTATADDDAALVTAGAVYDADMVLQANIDANTNLIGSNLVLITNNANAISVNAANITANDSDIAANVAAIAANAAAIAANAVNIASNDSDIAANAAAIQVNADAIAVNAANIAANDSDIAANVLAIASNAADISANAIAIASNKDLIDSNYDLIMSNADDIEANALAIASTWAFIEDDLDLQWVYENGHEINIIDNNPVQIYSDQLHGGLDVIASGDAEIGIDARLSGSTAAEYTTIQANLDDEYVAQLGASDGVSSAAVYGLITANNVYGALGASVSDGTTSKDYAGYFNGNAFVKSVLTISESGYIYLNNTIGSGDSNSGAMVVKGGVGIGENLNVAGDVNVDLDLFVARNTRLGDDIDDDMVTIDAITTINGATTINNTLDVTDAVWMGSTLDVDGATTLNSTLNVSDVATFESDVFAKDNLYVTNNTEIGGTLEVDGATTLNSTLQVVDNAQFDADVNVDGATTLNDILDVDGATTLNNTLNVAGNAHFESPVTMSSTLDVDGAVNLNDAVTVDGLATFDGDADFNANLNVDNTFALGTVEGLTNELMIGQGSGNTPAWTSVADLMEDLTDGAGIVDFTYDGSMPATVEADIDGVTIEFNGMDQIAVDEDNAFTWTNTHIFEGEVDVQGYIHNSNDALLIDDDAVVTGALEAGTLHVLGTSALDGDVTAGNNVDVAQTLSATTVSATTGNITTVNATDVNATTVTATTGDITTVNSTTGNITTVNATDVNTTNVDATNVDVDHLTVNNDIAFDGETIAGIDNTTEVPLTGNVTVPTSGAVAQHVEDRLDILYFQELYDNAVASLDLDNLHINATDGPLQIFAPTANGGLDVYGSDVAEDAIDARLETTATEAATIQAILDGTIYGYLGAKTATETAAVYGTDGVNWGAIAYTDGSKGAYAGYFDGNVHMTNDLRVMNNATIGAPTGGVLTVAYTLGATATNNASLIVSGGAGINKNLMVGTTIDAGTGLYVGPTGARYLEVDVNGTTIGTDPSELLTVNSTALFNENTTVDADFVVTGTSDLQGDVTAGANLYVEGNTDLNGTLTVSGASTFNNTAEFNGDATFNADLDVRNTFSLTGVEGNTNELMIGQGTGATPVWITVADLMQDLTDGAGIEDFTYDGSNPAVVTASIDEATIIFTGADSDITVNEGHAFNWTAEHRFQDNINAEATIYNNLGSLMLNDDVEISGTLDVTGDADFAAAVTVDGATTLNSTLDVADATHLMSTLEVDGTALFNAPVTTMSEVTVGEDLTVNGNTQLDGMLAVDGTAQFNAPVTTTSDVTVGEDLHVVGTSALDGIVTTLTDVNVGGNLGVAGNAAVTGSATITEDLTVNGSAINLGNDCGDNLTVNAAANFLCVVDMQQSLTVEGITTLNDDLTVNADTDLNGVLTVSDVATFASNIDARAAITNTLTDIVVVDDSFTVNENLLVNGTSHFVDAVTMSSTLEVDGQADFNADVYADLDLYVGNNLDVAGTSALDGIVTTGTDVNVGGNLDVTGTSTLDLAVTTGATLAVGTDLTVNNDATINNDLTVAHDVTIGTDCSDQMTVNAAAEFLCAVTFSEIILDGQSLTTVRTNVAGDEIRTDGTAEDTELITEAAIADWLPETRGNAQVSRALVLDGSGNLAPGGTLAGFSIDAGLGTISANNFVGGSYSGTVSASSLTVSGISTFNDVATFNDPVSIADAISFATNPTYIEDDHSGTGIMDSNLTIITIVPLNVPSGLPTPASNANKIITVINTSGAPVTYVGKIINNNEAGQFVCDGSNWFPIN